MITRLGWLALTGWLAAACHSTGLTPATSSVVPSGAREHMLRAGEQDLYAVEWPGSGTPLVMLHGLGGNAASWTALVRQLPGRHVIALDLPGHGRSPLPASWDFAPMATELVMAVRARWPGQHIWVGHSWGGKLAVVAAALDSGRTRGLILVEAVQASPLVVANPTPTVERLFAGELEPWPSMDSALLAVRALPQFSPWSPNVERAFRRAVVVQTDGRVLPLLSREKGSAVMRTFGQDFTSSATTIRAPVLVLSAPNSPFERAQRALFPAADFTALSGNHWLQISNVSGVSDTVKAWLKKHGL
jgi:pimeloyl-ACP methyl ester carboxylesterase